MAASKNDISRWFDRGRSEGASHMIVAVDQFDWDDYPVYVGRPAAVRAEIARILSSDMQRVMEIYDLGMDKECQLAEHRSWHPPNPAPAQEPFPDSADR